MRKYSLSMRKRCHPRTVLLFAAFAFLCGATSPLLRAQVEMRLDVTPVNLLSGRGVPLSDEAGAPTGSDGRAPDRDTQLNANLTTDPPTANQYQGVIIFGGSTSTNVSDATGTPTRMDAEPRVAVVETGTVVFRMSRIRIGSPYFRRDTSFKFGEVIPPPDKKANGDILPAGDGTNYWAARPFTNGVVTEMIASTDSAGDTVMVARSFNQFYYSPHANQVFAVQAGPIDIIWERQQATPEADVPVGERLAPDSFSLINGKGWRRSGAAYYRLLSKRYVVSGSPVKPPRNIFWTKGRYEGRGLPVSVAAEQLNDVNIVFNRNLPEFVTPAEAAPFQAQNTSVAWTNTLHWERNPGLNQIHALNKEGRVFVELLGDTVDAIRQQHLGFEIVDVQREATPETVAVDLGEAMGPFATPREEGRNLFPEGFASATKFAYRHLDAASGRPIYYAIRKTENLNDMQLFWLEAGVEGLRWPNRLVRYRQDWPTDVTDYSHYIRPASLTKEHASQTAVTLPANYPIQKAFEDALPNDLGAYITANQQFYTYLNEDYPVHRTLLQHLNGEDVAFERVLSWLDAGLVANAQADGRFAGTAAAELAAFDPTTGTVDFPAALAPRVIETTALVGQRISAPAGEATSGFGQDYLAGFINPVGDDHYHPGAYRNPFEVGFTNANLGAILPVNAPPQAAPLEVWWFRPSSPDTQRGFERIYWPAVIARYQVNWPSDPPEIVLASNDGSGPLSGPVARGRIYVQNDPNAAGFNPNEEHALMSGGQAFALRDDLNVLAGDDYSSHPFVLVDFITDDGRPAMRAYRVFREKPEEGIVFSYRREVPLPLQPPMPLPLMDLVDRGAGVTDVRNLSEEVVIALDDIGGQQTVIDHYPTSSSALALAIEFGETPTTEDDTDYVLVHPTDPDRRFWFHSDFNNATEARGYPSRHPIIDVVAWDAATQQLIVSATAASGLAVNDRLMLVDTVSDGQELGHVASVSVVEDEMTIGFQNPVMLATFDKGVRVAAPMSGELSGWRLFRTSSPPSIFYQEGDEVSGGGFVFEDRKGTPWIYRGPNSDMEDAVFGMRFYYKVREGFYFPGEDNGPERIGTVTPYLRKASDEGGFEGANEGQLNQALTIIYRPAWPANPAEMRSGYTLTTPAFDLPAIRGQSSVQVVYQQSAHQAESQSSVTLHDPTREKIFFLDENPDSVSRLGALPESARTDVFRGKTYFPNLPPHLNSRFFLDPNRGANGALVLAGEFVDSPLGEDYLNLNTLSGSDLGLLKGLATDGDERKSLWDNALDGLSTQLERFVEDDNVPGSFIPLNSGGLVGPTTIPAINHPDIAVDSYALSANGPGHGFVTLAVGNGANPDFTPTESPVSLHVFRVVPQLHRGEVKIILSSNPLAEKLTFQQVTDLAAKTDDFVFEWRIAVPEDGSHPPFSPSADTLDPKWELVEDADGNRYVLGGTPGIRTLVDNWITVRYGPKDAADSMSATRWSEWTAPVLAEGWIKRVLAGINPFNQRVNDLFNNTVNSTASILAQAGTRWEGDVALNLDTINDVGLIPIYETVLRRGRSFSIEADVNYGPANDALLLAAGYLNDLYMMLGNEARADAANPTIGIGTDDAVLGDIATAMFAFKGQVPTLLEEELALLRGRDSFPNPGVEITPVYNRLIWNYTRGIDSGEVIYALNYNITEDEANGVDGKIDAADAQKMYPQGHGDAYGHFLTALKGYYHLFVDDDFTWVPRTEAVNVLGKPVSVDYLDERKFAAAASALAAAGQQVFELTWRKDFKSGATNGWEHFQASRADQSRTNATSGEVVDTTRYWGVDHWASRTGQGAYLNWVLGNSMLPAEDTDPEHEGIEKIDRTTVPELDQLPRTAEDLQFSMDSAEAFANPLGLAETSIPFDINPADGFATGHTSHFEQILERAEAALKNAVASFNDAKHVTHLMRAEENSLSKLQADIAAEEMAFTNSLIEIYGTPYPEDIGPGKTYKTGYVGPDLIHHMYVDNETREVAGVFSNDGARTFKLDTQLYEIKDDLSGFLNITSLTRNEQGDWTDQDGNVVTPPEAPLRDEEIRTTNAPSVSIEVVLGIPTISSTPEEIKVTPARELDTHYIEYRLDSHGFFEKPPEWRSRRQAPGELQTAISDVIVSHGQLQFELANMEWLKYVLDRQYEVFEAQNEFEDHVFGLGRDKYLIETSLASAEALIEIASLFTERSVEVSGNVTKTLKGSVPQNTVLGLASGGDLTSAARAAIEAGGFTVTESIKWLDAIKGSLLIGLQKGAEFSVGHIDAIDIPTAELDDGQRNGVLGLDMTWGDVQWGWWTINQRIQEYQGRRLAYNALLAKGERLQGERELFRKRSAALVQGYRTRDAAFRIFRNEKLERYKALFDLAARYAFMAAQAYDYETGLLHTPAGRRFVEKIVAARALGVVDSSGNPLFAGSETGDPGLSSALAEMKADWSVLRGRLGINNPDTYDTTMSLRLENYRILPGSVGSDRWEQVLRDGLRTDLRTDPDVRRYCMQISRGEGLPVPGLVLEFDSTITPGLNFFGEKLAPGDHMFSSGSFATKIFSVGVVMEGYRGMDNPSANTATILAGGGESPADPSILDPNALAATPLVYLVPVGDDLMRSPPLGDQSVVRRWKVDDVTIPLPFNIGASEFSAQPFYRTSDSLSEPLFGIRKHQAFRPVSTTAVYSGNPRLIPSQFTNSRLIGRSVWNTRWKLVIPGHHLLNDPDEGLRRLLRTVSDIKLRLETYSYAGN